MKNKSSIFTAILLLLNIITTAFPIFAAENPESLIEEIISYKSVGGDAQSWLDGELAENAGLGAEWYVIALSQYDPSLDFNAYLDALDAYLSVHDEKSAATRQRYALAYIACGRYDCSYVKSTLEDSIGEGGVMSLIFGLHMLNNGLESSKISIDTLINELLSQHKSDGGWAITGDYSDVDVTAMAVQALAPYYDDDEVVKTAVDSALEFLSEKQLDSGGFKSYGVENAESAAQVITALASLGINPADDDSFIKNEMSIYDTIQKFKLDGGYSHIEGGEESDTATAQIFYSLIALWRLDNGKGSLYIFDKKESYTPVTEQSETAVVTDTIMETEPQIEKTVGGLTPEQKQESSSGSIEYKPIVCAVISAAVVIAFLYLILLKKRNIKNFIFVIIVGAAAIAVTLLTNIATVDEYYKDEAEKVNIIGSCILEIRCDTIIGEADSEYIPSDGVILAQTEFALGEGETVFDILVEAAKKYNIQVENKGSNAGGNGLVYISGINYIYEFDFGELSGWVYHVNGEAGSVGCGEYKLSDGDKIEWLYTRDLGNDI